MGKAVFENPAASVKKELEDLERLDEATSTHKPRAATKATVIGDLADTFTNQLNLLQEEERTSNVVITEEELTAKLSEVFMLDKEGNGASQKPTSGGDSKPKGVRDSETEEKRIQKQIQDSVEPRNTKPPASTVDKLMALIDKRDALLKEKETSQNSKSGASDDSGAGGGGKHQFVSSTSVLGNIRRVQAQRNCDLDSDDEDVGGGEAETPGGAHSSELSQPRAAENEETSFSNDVTLAPLQLIQRTLKEWRTEATVNFLTKSVKESKSEFDRKYEELEKSVPARQIRDDTDDDSSEDEEQEVRFFSHCISSVIVKYLNFRN